MLHRETKTEESDDFLPLPASVALKVHPKVAQRVLRHSQIAMTTEVSAEASEEEVRAALGKLSASTGGSATD